ncbi:hypothetical protein Tco_0378563 [Tanacetum coccineum]
MMTTEYCPETEIQRMKQELWTLTLKGDDIEAYRNITSSKHATLHEAINMARELVEQSVQGRAARIGGRKLPGPMLQPQPRVEVMLEIYQRLAYHELSSKCLRRIFRIPLPNGKILEVQGERPEKDLRSLACIKADEKKLDDIRVV